MSEPIKAWAIKHPADTDILTNSISRVSENLAWAKLFGYLSPNDPRVPHYIAEMIADGYRAVRVEIREVEE